MSPSNIAIAKVALTALVEADQLKTDVEHAFNYIKKGESPYCLVIPADILRNAQLAPQLLNTIHSVATMEIDRQAKILEKL